MISIEAFACVYIMHFDQDPFSPLLLLSPGSRDPTQLPLFQPLPLSSTYERKYVIIVLLSLAFHLNEEHKFRSFS